jgi:hypothetical protein
VNDIEISIEMFESEVDIINLASVYAEYVDKRYAYEQVYVYLTEGLKAWCYGNINTET